MLGHRLDVTAESRQRPVARRVGIGHRLERGEGLRGDDEECLGRIQIADRLGEIGAIDIGNKAEGHVPLAVVAKRLVGHDGAEIRTADPDVDHVLDALAGVSLPLTASHALGKGTHGFENLVDLGNDIHAVHFDHLSLGRPEGHVQDGPVLGDVDLLPGEHLVAVLLQTDFLGELNQVFQRLVIDAVLRVIEIESAGLGRQALSACGVGGKEFLQRRLGDLITVRGEGFPCWEFGGVGHNAC